MQLLTISWKQIS